MKKKIIPLIISAAVFLAGLVTVIISVSQNSGTVPEYPEIDLFSISDNDVGKTFSGGKFYHADAVYDGHIGYCRYNKLCLTYQK